MPTLLLTEEDAYRTLEIKKGATAAEIKSAYKKLALKTHPDKNPNDTSACKRFLAVSEAYKRLMIDDFSDEDDYCDDYDDEDEDFDISEIFAFRMFERMFFDGPSNGQEKGGSSSGGGKNKRSNNGGNSRSGVQFNFPGMGAGGCNCPDCRRRFGYEKAKPWREYVPKSQRTDLPKETVKEVDPSIHDNWLSDEDDRPKTNKSHTKQKSKKAQKRENAAKEQKAQLERHERQKMKEAQTYKQNNHQELHEDVSSRETNSKHETKSKSKHSNDKDANTSSLEKSIKLDKIGAKHISQSRNDGKGFEESDEDSEAEEDDDESDLDIEEMASCMGISNSTLEPKSQGKNIHSLSTSKPKISSTSDSKPTTSNDREHKYKNQIESLQEMGFEYAQCVQAIESSFGSVELAATMLLQCQFSDDVSQSSAPNGISTTSSTESESDTAVMKSSDTGPSKPKVSASTAVNNPSKQSQNKHQKPPNTIKTSSQPPPLSKNTAISNGSNRSHNAAAYSSLKSEGQLLQPQNGVKPHHTPPGFVGHQQSRHSAEGPKPSGSSNPEVTLSPNGTIAQGLSPRSHQFNHFEYFASSNSNTNANIVPGISLPSQSTPAHSRPAAKQQPVHQPSNPVQHQAEHESKFFSLFGSEGSNSSSSSSSSHSSRSPQDTDSSPSGLGVDLNIDLNTGGGDSDPLGLGMSSLSDLLLNDQSSNGRENGSSMYGSIFDDMNSGIKMSDLGLEGSGMNGTSSESVSFSSFLESSSSHDSSKKEGSNESSHLESLLLGTMDSLSMENMISPSLLEPTGNYSPPNRSMDAASTTASSDQYGRGDSTSNMSSNTAAAVVRNGISASQNMAPSMKSTTSKQPNGVAPKTVLPPSSTHYSGASSSSTRCLYFFSPRGCRHGSSCKFSHDASSNQSLSSSNGSRSSAYPPSKKPCLFFLSPQGCKHGSACRFVHNKNLK